MSHQLWTERLLIEAYIRIELVEIVGIQLFTALCLGEQILEELVLVNFVPQSDHILIGHFDLVGAQIFLDKQNVIRVERCLEVLPRRLRYTPKMINKTTYILTSNLIEFSFNVRINVLLTGTRSPIAPLFEPFGSDHFPQTRLCCHGESDEN